MNIADSCGMTQFLKYGLQVRLHNPVETPKVADFGFLVSAGEEYRVTIRPIISNASPSLRKIPENKRQCLFSNEKYLKFYRTYTQRNCALECEANYTLATCSCVPYYLPSRCSLLLYIFQNMTDTWTLLLIYLRQKKETAWKTCVYTKMDLK